MQYLTNIECQDDAKQYETIQEYVFSIQGILENTDNTDNADNRDKSNRTDSKH